MKNEAEKERKREGLGRGLRTRSDQRTHIGLPTVFWPAEEAWFRSLRCRRRRRSLCRCEVWSSRRTMLRWCRFCGERERRRQSTTRSRHGESVGREAKSLWRELPWRSVKAEKGPPPSQPNPTRWEPQPELSPSPPPCGMRRGRKCEPVRDNFPRYGVLLL